MSTSQYAPDRSYGMFIDNQWVDAESGETIESINPATGEVLTRIPSGTAADVDRAVQAAQRAFAGWRATTVTERANALNRIADLLEADAERFAVLESLDVGKPIRESRVLDVPIAIDHFRYFAGVIRSHSDEAAVLDEQTLSLVLSEPLGVVGQVIPWNFPLLMAAWKIAPAIATGNTVVIKPSEMTPVSISELAKIFAQVLPPVSSTSSPAQGRLPARPCWITRRYRSWHSPVPPESATPSPKPQPKDWYQQRWSWAANRRISFSPTRIGTRPSRGQPWRFYGIKAKPANPELASSFTSRSTTVLSTN